MKITPADRKAINAYARTQCLGGLSHVEASYRSCPGYDDHMNLAFFPAGAGTDLVDLVRLASLKTVEDHPSGRVAVDLYVYERRPYGDRELVTNLTAEWQDGALVRVYDPLRAVVIKRVPGDGSTWL